MRSLIRESEKENTRPSSRNMLCYRFPWSTPNATLIRRLSRITSIRMLMISPFIQAPYQNFSVILQGFHAHTSSEESPLPFHTDLNRERRPARLIDSIATRSSICSQPSAKNYRIRTCPYPQTLLPASFLSGDAVKTTAHWT